MLKPLWSKISVPPKTGPKIAVFDVNGSKGQFLVLQTRTPKGTSLRGTHLLTYFVSNIRADVLGVDDLKNPHPK